MKITCLLLILLSVANAFAQPTSGGPFIHSHNDYYQKEPLLCALSAAAKSIEIDLFLHDDKLVVAHSKSEIKKSKTLEELYILPLKKYLSETSNVHDFHLMIDIKSEPFQTLAKIELVLKQYPEIFSTNGIQVIISGNRPNPNKYVEYANFIWFDGREASDAEEPGGERIAMISQNLSKFTRWRGRGEITEKDKIKLESFIAQCHAKNKPVRLWNTGDNKNMYTFLYAMGVDYINTDKPKVLRTFIDSKNGK